MKAVTLKWKLIENNEYVPLVCSTDCMIFTFIMKWNHSQLWASAPALTGRKHFSAECYENLSLPVWDMSKEQISLSSQSFKLKSSYNEPFFNHKGCNLRKHLFTWRLWVFCSQWVGCDRCESLCCGWTGTQEAHWSGTYFQRAFGFWNHFHLFCSQYWLQCSLFHSSCWYMSFFVRAGVRVCALSGNRSPQQNKNRETAQSIGYVWVLVRNFSQKE